MLRSGTCQLCLKSKELQRKCHIIPSIFRRVLNSDGSPRARVIQNGNWRICQDHFYGEYVFCRDCENDVFNKTAEHPVSAAYLKTSNPYFDDDEPMMRLAISVCFRAALSWQANHPCDDLMGPIRSWRSWLTKESPSPLLYRVGGYTYDRDGQLSEWQKIMREVMCFDVMKYNGTAMIWVNVPGVVFWGILASDGLSNPSAIFETDDSCAEMVEQVSMKLAAKLLDSFPKEPPTDLKNRA